MIFARVFTFTNAARCTILRSIIQMMTSLVLAMVVVGITLVPMWQVIGHASEPQHSVAEVADTYVHAVKAKVGVHAVGHHSTADHAHELPILGLADLAHVVPSSKRWDPPTPLNGDGTAPSDPEQPPQHI